MKVQLLNKDAKMPSKGSEQSAGFDLYSTQNYDIKPNEQVLISTGIALQIPNGCYGRIAPRSGFSVKGHSDIGAGVIDNDYRGEIKVLVRNLSTVSEVSIKKNDKIAQIIITPYVSPELEQVKELTTTKRGKDGFGSTGN